MTDAILEPTLPIGHHLHDYEIQKVLGAGGFGITYRAIHRRLGTEVAIKEFMPRDFSFRDSDLHIKPHSARIDCDKSDEIFTYGLERFLKEAQDLSLFSHPNIIRARNFFEANGTAYIVMDYARGETLKAWLQAKGEPPDEATLKAIFLPLLDGLQEVHLYGLLHRDIKPDNIYIQENGVPLLLDFGTARNAVGSRSESIHVVIAEGYSPKEQYASAGKQGAWSDIYAVGATLYRSITGNSPAGAIDRSEALDSGEPDPVVSLAKEFAGQYSKPFLETIDRCLEFNQSDRPQRVADVRNGLLGVSGAAGDAEPIRPGSDPMSDTVIRNRTDRISESLEKFDVSAHYALSAQSENSSLPSGRSAIAPSAAKAWRTPLIVLACVGVTGAAVYFSDLGEKFKLNNDIDRSASIPERGVTEGDVASLLVQVDNYNEKLEAAKSALERPTIDRIEKLRSSADELAVNGQYAEAVDTLRTILGEQSSLLATSPRKYVYGSNEIQIKNAMAACEVALGKENCAPAWFERERKKEVKLVAFSLDKTEVTNADFAQFINKTGHLTRAEQVGYSLQQMPSLEIYKLDGFSWRAPQGGKSDISNFIEHPVVHVSYGDALAYCEYKGARLPTNAEWEYAVTGGTDKLYASYYTVNEQLAVESASTLMASVSVNDRTIYDQTTKLFGATGNVSEWTETIDTSSTNGKMRIVKGGSWNEVNPSYMRVAALRPEYASDTYIDVGFRCARTLDFWPES